MRSTSRREGPARTDLTLLSASSRGVGVVSARLSRRLRGTEWASTSVCPYDTGGERGEETKGEKDK